MSKMDWRNIECPELDMYVAETIMGWQRLSSNKWTHPDGSTGYTSVPAYSSFLIAAWDVISTSTQHFELHKSAAIKHLWECQFDGHIGYGRIPALAICRAALLKHEEKKCL